MRGLLLGIITLGSVASGVGFTGVIAPTTDTAKTGTVTKERVETGAFPSLVDLKIAPWSPSSGAAPASCGTFSDDLTTGIFQISSGTSRTLNETRSICVKNVGTQAKAISIVPEAVTFTDITCEPDEAAFSPAGCLYGVSGGLKVVYSITGQAGSPAGCPAVASPTGTAGELFYGGLVKAYSSSVTMALNTTCVYDVRLTSPTGGFTDDMQTDSVEWRFRVETL